MHETNHNIVETDGVHDVEDIKQNMSIVALRVAENGMHRLELQHKYTLYCTKLYRYPGLEYLIKYLTSSINIIYRKT